VVPKAAAMFVLEALVAVGAEDPPALLMLHAEAVPPHQPDKNQTISRHPHQKVIIYWYPALRIGTYLPNVSSFVGSIS
jgi:hypothetical protein